MEATLTAWDEIDVEAERQGRAAGKLRIYTGADQVAAIVGPVNSLVRGYSAHRLRAKHRDRAKRAASTAARLKRYQILKTLAHLPTAEAVRIARLMLAAG